MDKPSDWRQLSWLDFQQRYYRRYQERTSNPYRGVDKRHTRLLLKPASVPQGWSYKL